MTLQDVLCEVTIGASIPLLRWIRKRSRRIGSVPDLAIQVLTHLPRHLLDPCHSSPQVDRHIPDQIVLLA